MKPEMGAGMANINLRLEYTKPQSAAAVRSAQTRAELGQHIGQALGDVLAHLKTLGVQSVGPPFAHYSLITPNPDDRLDVIAGWPVEQPVHANDSIISWILPGGKAAVATHTGPYTNIVQTCQELLDWMAHQHLEVADGLIEQYISNPETEPDQSKWRTEIYIPLK